MSQPLRIRLTGRASRYLGMLLDFGHLDERRYEQVLVALADQLGSPGAGSLVDLPHIRPIVAALLFTEDVEAESGRTSLAEDWPPLFY